MSIVSEKNKRWTFSATMSLLRPKPVTRVTSTRHGDQFTSYIRRSFFCPSMVRVTTGGLSFSRHASSCGYKPFPISSIAWSAITRLWWTQRRIRRSSTIGRADSSHGIQWANPSGACKRCHQWKQRATGNWLWNPLLGIMYVSQTLFFYDSKTPKPLWPIVRFHTVRPYAQTAQNFEYFWIFVARLSGIIVAGDWPAAREHLDLPDG
jgi:hypothetical protein